MRGLVTTKDGVLSIRELPMPKTGDYNALVKMEACGICNGTDAKIIHGTFKNFDTYPAVLGHEGVGRVVETGNKVKNLKEGDLVLLPFIEGMAGDCYSGWGAFSEYAVVGDADAMLSNGIDLADIPESYFAQKKLPDDMDVIDGVMIITFREVLSAMRRFGFEAGKSAVIFGAGPVGLSFIKFSKLMGISPVIAFDISDEKTAEALRAGADHAFNLKLSAAAEVVSKILPDKADFVVDAAGINHIINDAMKLIKYNGKICCYGISPELNMHIDWSEAPYNWSLNFVQWPSKKEEAAAHDQILSWLHAGELRAADYISDVIHFDDIISAFDMVLKGGAKKKVIIKF